MFTNESDLPDEDYAAGLLTQARLEMPGLAAGLAALLDRCVFVVSVLGDQPDITNTWAGIIRLLQEDAPKLGIQLGQQSAPSQPE